MVANIEYGRKKMKDIVGKKAREKRKKQQKKKKKKKKKNETALKVAYRSFVIPAIIFINILRLFDNLPNFPFATSETKHSY